MDDIQVGIRVLFEPLGCKFSSDEEFTADSQIVTGEFVEVYLGAKPRFGLYLMKNKDFIIPGKPGEFVEYKYSIDPAEISHPERFFFEVTCLRSLPVDKQLLDRALTGDPNAPGEILQLVTPYCQTLRNIITVIADFLALSIHRQLVLRPLNENLVGRLPNKKPISQIDGSPMELLEDLRINDSGKQIISQFIKQLDSVGPSTFSDISNTVEWLRRAWTEKDPISKFMFYFIALERVLAGVPAPRDSAFARSIGDIRELINNHPKLDNKEELLQFIDQKLQNQTPSLKTRFESLARNIKLDGFEDDIEAFKKFSNLRQGLIHRGNSSVPLSIAVRDDEIIQLEDLAERYVGRVLFGLQAPYQSRWRRITKASSRSEC